MVIPPIGLCLTTGLGDFPQDSPGLVDRVTVFREDQIP
jgi:hypothetical protein